MGVWIVRAYYETVVVADNYDEAFWEGAAALAYLATPKCVEVRESQLLAPPDPLAVPDVETHHNKYRY